MEEIALSHPNKVRGNTLEREIVHVAKKKGLEARRAWGSDGRSLGCGEGVDNLVAGKKIQAKREKVLAKSVKKKLAYLRPEGECDAVVFREDRGEMFVLLRADDYFELLQSSNAKLTHPESKP